MEAGGSTLKCELLLAEPIVAHPPEQLLADVAPAAAVVLPVGHKVQVGPAGPPALQEPMPHCWHVVPAKPGRQTGED